MKHVDIETADSFLPTITSATKALRVWSIRWPGITLSAAAIAAFVPIKITLLVGQHFGSQARLAIFAVLCLSALSLTQARTTSLSRPPRLVLRGVIALFVMYLLWTDLPIVTSELSSWHAAEKWLYGWPSAGLGLLACWRLSWSIPFLTAVVWQKSASSEILGIPITQTDYAPLIEVSLLLALGGLLLTYGRRFLGLWALEKKDGDKALTATEAVLLTALAAHFSNYFYSAVQKLRVGDTWWQWVLENPTYKLSLAAWETGSLPVTTLGNGMVAHLIEASILLNVPLNAITLLAQLIAVFAITRIQWAILLTAFYDITHVVIFLVSGIFFYKWIWLNLLLVVALGLIADRELRPALKAWLAAILLAAPSVFFVAFLGWLDTSSFNDEYVEAITVDGESYRVPSNYFLAGSVTHAQQRFVRDKPRHFPTNAYGSMYLAIAGAQRFRQAVNCNLDVGPESGVPKAAKEANIPAQLRRHHSYVLKNADPQGSIHYDRYPHHIYSMPWEYQDFADLDKRRIMAYRYVVESKCLRYDHERQRLNAKTILHGSLKIPLP